MQTTTVKNISNDYSDWKIILEFYKDELSVFTDRLNEINGKNAAKEILQKLEHFQDRFSIQSENISTLLQDINGHTIITNFNRDRVPVFALQTRVENEVSAFKKTKVEFIKFLTAQL